MINSFVPLRRAPAILALVLPMLVAMSASAQAENLRHHLGLALGYQRLLSDDLKNEAEDIDFRNSGFGAVAYRLSVLPNLDVCLDARATTSTQTVSGVDLTLTNSFFGPGVRLIAPNEGMRPFIQANVFLVDEQIEVEEGDATVSVSKSGAGFGILGGVDIRASNLLSIPIEANFMYGNPSDDVSGLGFNVGLTFNFGRM